MINSCIVLLKQLLDKEIRLSFVCESVHMRIKTA